MSCVFCEGPITPGMRYCPHCGTFLNSKVAVGPPYPGKPYQAETERPSTSARPRYGYSKPSQTSTAAIVSLIAGIATWVVLPVLPAIVAIVAGHQARQDIRDSGGRVTGDALAQIGLVLGYLQVGLIVIGLILFLVVGGLVLTLS